MYPSEPVQDLLIPGAAYQMPLPHDVPVSASLILPCFCLALPSPFPLPLSPFFFQFREWEEEEEPWRQVEVNALLPEAITSTVLMDGPTLYSSFPIPEWLTIHLKQGLKYS